LGEEDDDEDEVEPEPDVEAVELEVLVEELSAFELLVSDAFDLDSPSPEELALLRPLLEDEDERESVMYQPLPLKTMPTG